MTLTEETRFQLYYWPLPFRGCFVSYLFAYRDVALSEISSFDEIGELKNQPVGDQPIPFVGPPMLLDRQSGRALSQMPAIVLHVADELDLMPDDLAIGVKVLMDCNDLLMEICRYNGSMMWDRASWLEFRKSRLPRWLGVFEESLRRGHFGGDKVSFADISVYALLGNMTRCLPELDADVRKHAPGVYALCESIGAQPSLAAFVAQQEQQYGRLYCGGQIEASIREMLALDSGTP